VEDPAAALVECRRVSKPGAQLVLTQNLPETMRAFYDVYEGVLRQCGLETSLEALRRHIHAKRRPLEEVRALLAGAGFDMLRVEEGTFPLRFLDGTALLTHSFVRLGFLDAWRSVPPEGERERVFAVLEERLNEVARERGELRLDVPFACLDCRATD
jgi:arsenite methyltransferase